MASMSDNAADENCSIWKVYIPHKLFTSECRSAPLVGFIREELNLICVTALFYSTPEDFVKFFDKCNVRENYASQTTRPPRPSCLGCWTGNDKSYRLLRENWTSPTLAKSSAGRTVWIDIYLSDEGLPVCDFAWFGPNPEREWSPQAVQRATCIIFDAEKVMSSYILCDAGHRALVSSLAGNSQLVQMMSPLRNIDTVVHCLTSTEQQYQRHPSTRKDWGHPALGPFVTNDPKQHKPNFLCCILTTLLSCAYINLGKILDNRLFHQHYLELAMNVPAVLHQIRLRSRQVKRASQITPQEPLQQIRCLNVQTRLIVDSALGLSLMVFLMWTGITEKMSEYIITWADSVVIWLNGLLDWLMGVPAGLKLNSQLDQFLGRFFHYHIYLWTGYLSLLKPVLAPLLWYSSMVGVLGLSVQLCLLQDIISTLTLHIYCFYVYAARLYYFQVYGLSSLWRLFRGKKWNVLRRRVDSASYDVDQLFVGTILFTILLFLLPTTALYYVVFLGLRLLVLMMNGVVSKCVSIINGLPVHGVLLRLLNSPFLTGDLKFTVLPEQASEKSLFVAMQATQLPFSKLVRVLREECIQIDQRPTYTWGKLIKRMCMGELIYPWIEPAVDNSKMEN